MKEFIHGQTIKKYLKDCYCIDAEIKSFTDNAKNETNYVVYLKRADLALFAEKDDGTLICMNSSGEPVSTDDIFVYAKAADVQMENGEISFKADKLRITLDGEEMDKYYVNALEEKIYPERTPIVMQAVLIKNGFQENIAPFYVDEVLYVDDGEFDKIKKLEYSKVLEEYNKKFYKRVDDGEHGVVVINESGDGLLIDTQDYDYARYMSFAPKIAPAIEQMLLDNMRQKAIYNMKLYVPIKVTYENYIDNTVAETEDTSHTWEVQEKIREFNKFYGDRGLAQYLEKNNSCRKKVYSIKPDVECVNDVMMGVVAIKMTKPLNDEEIADIKDFVTEQMSDGWSELFEKQNIQVKDGQIYIHFWDKEQYFIKTEDEMYEEDGIEMFQSMQRM